MSTETASKLHTEALEELARIEWRLDPYHVNTRHYCPSCYAVKEAGGHDRCELDRILTAARKEGLL